MKTFNDLLQRGDGDFLPVAKSIQILQRLSPWAQENVEVRWCRHCFVLLSWEINGKRCGIEMHASDGFFVDLQPGPLGTSSRHYDMMTAVAALKTALDSINTL